MTNTLNILKPIDAVRYLNDRWSIKVTASGLLALAQSGRGPALFQRSPLEYHEAALDRWVGEHFEKTDLVHAPARFHGRPIGVGERPRWLVVTEADYDGYLIADGLAATGCHVEHAFGKPALALELASSGDFDAAFIRDDRHIEEQILIGATLVERRIPFLVGTQLAEVPGLLTSGGVVLRMPMDLDNIAFVIERRIPTVAARMDLSKLDSPAHDESEEIPLNEADKRFIAEVMRKEEHGRLGDEPDLFDDPDSPASHDEEPMS